MLVWDENHELDRYAEVEKLVRRDRNHPSVIIWSLCNEKMCDQMIHGGVPAFNADGLMDKQIFQRWDPSMGRPVSANPHDFSNWSVSAVVCWAWPDLTAPGCAGGAATGCRWCADDSRARHSCAHHAGPKGPETAPSWT